MLVNETIPNMVNGVSQQPPSIRLSSQCELQENCVPSIVEGLRKRSPTKHIAKIHTGTLGDAYVKTINRDTVEQYVATITNGDLKVHDLDGNEKTVTFPDGKAYLNTLTPSKMVRAVTVADYTFIINSEIETAMAADLSYDPGVEAIFHVRQGAYGSPYVVKVDASTDTYTTSTTDVTTIQTSHIAEQLRAGLVTALGAGWTLQRVGSSVLVRKDDETDFTIETSDGLGDNGVKSVKNGVQRFTDLPTVAPQGFVSEVEGDDDSAFDNYYVNFNVDGGSGFGRGTWKEGLAKGIQYKIDASTMPHALIRQADGTFTFEQVVWGERTVGDDFSAPEPSFIGSTINDIFFFKNRLGFLSGQNIIMSKAGEYFQFFPDTVTTLLADAPIDAAASHTKVSILKRAIAFDEQLLLFSDQTQFVLQGSDVLSSATVQIDPATEYEAALNANPVSIDDKVYFGSASGNYDRVQEYSVNPESSNNEADDITSHAPNYIPAGITKFAATSNDSTLVCLTEGAQDRVYMYTYFEGDDGDKLQSAWGEWKFHSTSKVLNVDFLGTDLFFVIQHGDGVYLEKMSMSTRDYDEYTDQFSPYGFITHLDRRITDADLVSAVYDDITGTTALTLPYPVEGTYEVTTRAIADGSVIPARALNITDVTGSVITVLGDHSASSLYLGQKYMSRYRFSEQVVKKSTASGSQAAITSGRLQLLYWVVNYDNSGSFRVEVTPDLGQTFVYTHTGRVIGHGDNIIGQVSITSGEFRFPVNAESTAVTIDVINDTFLPSNFLSAEYHARFNMKGNRR